MTEIGDAVSFTNAYKYDTEIDTDDPNGDGDDADALFKKIVTGSGFAENEFTFNLTPAEGSPNPAKTEVKKSFSAATEGTAIDFGKIKFTAPGTYTYTFTEVVPETVPTGWTYDADAASGKTVTITVAENADGDLAVTEIGDAVSFTNSYTDPTPPTPPTPPAPTKYTVTYEYVGDVPEGAPEVPPTRSYEVGATVPAAPVPSLEGYTFVGWDGEVTTMPAHNVLVTGRWVKNAKKVIIRYVLNGGEYNGSKADIVEEHEIGEVITIHEEPVREGYEFLYWKGSKYQPGDSYTVVGDHTFTAIWLAESEDDPDEPDNPDNPSNPDKPKKQHGVNTGDNSGIMGFLGIFGASVLGFFAMIFRRRREED